MDALFRLENVNFKNIIQYPNLSIEEGKVTFVVGKSGSGKSTLLSLLNKSKNYEEGQIISGTSPNLAILYQIAIMIAICTTVCMSVFGALHFGYKTLYNKEAQLTISFQDEVSSS